MEPGDLIELTVERPCESILEFLADELPLLPLNVIRRALARGLVSADGKRVDHRYVARPGQRVVVRLPEGPVVLYKPRAMDLEVIAEDEHLVAINKPAGVCVIPDAATQEATLINGLLHYVQHQSPLPCRRVYVVHRLDRDTTGALVFAKDVATARHLSACFEERRVAKRYLAVVLGELADEEGEVNLPLAPHSRGRMKVAERRGRPATTRYRVRERFQGYTLLEVEPLTGRQHQVRVHLSAIGHPLVVEPVYGGKDAVYLSELKRGYRRKPGRPEPPIIARLTLHASRLEFPAADGTVMSVEAELPRDLERLIRCLRKYRSRFHFQRPARGARMLGDRGR